MDWTDETIARLRELWSQGLSTAEIGRQLSITKNAVVGKAHRLGLPPRPSPIRNRKVKDGETPSTEVPRRKPPTRKAAAPAEATADLLGDKVDAKATPAKLDAPKAAPAKAAETVAARPVVAPVARAAAVPPLKAEAPAKPPAPEPRVAPPVRPAPPPRFTASIDRPTRRGPSCCWPIGDPGTPGFHFCGATPLPGKPYCAEHAAIAYVKIRDRRD